MVTRVDGRTLDVAPGSQSLIVDSTTSAALTDVVAARRGFSHGCALRSGGTVWCWATPGGTNEDGQLGDGQKSDSPTAFSAVEVRTNAPPAAATYLTGVSSLQQGLNGYLSNTNCVRKADSTIWCWGDNPAANGGDFMQTGVNTSYPLPSQLHLNASTFVTDAKQVALGTRHGCYVTNTGGVYCWGGGVGGALGSGSESASTYPVSTGLSNAVQVSTGGDFSCALIGSGAESGHVYCWGAMTSGAVGIGNPATTYDTGHGCPNYCKLTPARVVTDATTPTFLDDVVDIEAGYLGACALKADHTVWCWGNYANTSANIATQVVVKGVPITNAIAVTLVDEGELRVLTSDGKQSIVTPGTGTNGSFQDVAVSCGAFD
jgi:alpha-tubulin suppressor-like RCC1 family protein